MQTLEDLIKQLNLIKNRGYIKTHRPHDTGIGKTLEDLLNIQENNFRLPDVGDLELKAKRLDSDSMLTLATKSPLPRGVNKILFNNYKYVDEFGEYNLHSTIYGSKPNSIGFRILCQPDKIILANPLNIEVYWPISIFDDVLKAKSNKILLVFANTKGERKTATEEFHFVEAYLLSGLNKNKFVNAIVNDRLKVDIRIGVFRSGKFKGRYHDHGTGLRMIKKDFLSLFDNYAQLI
jgi:hypothetical protein